MKINKVGVLGAGLMGSGIAEVCAKAGYPTIVREVSDDLVKKGVGRVESSLAKAVERGKLAAADRDAARGRLTATTRVNDLAGCDLVIEAVVENLDAKKELFAELDRICGDSAIFCSNTSSLTITELAAATRRPDRFAGLHFFNPVPVMKLVEVVRTIATSDETVETLLEFAKSLGKEPVLAKDNSGFIVNRLLVPYLLDAVRALEEGVGSREDIDRGMELGCGHPMGPLKLLDFVGLDVALAIGETLHDETREPAHEPPSAIRELVRQGKLGKKAGEGFYTY
jgi:3-hydroxybutyryl-CoA dehydrogenase